MITNYIHAIPATPIAAARSISPEYLPVAHRQFRIPPISIEIARSAKAVFGRNNFYIQLGEHLASILEDIHMESLSEAETTLSQITFFQFLEGLTDAQAINAIRTRVDWKFALHLPSYFPKLSESALCEFRHKILIDPICQRDFQKLTDRLFLLDHPLNNRFRDFENLELVSIVCSINRLGLIHKAIHQALEVLACKFPLWLQKIALPHWPGRYHHKTSTTSLGQQKLSIRGYLLTSFAKSWHVYINSAFFTVSRHIWRTKVRKPYALLRSFYHVSEFNNYPANGYIQEMGTDIQYILAEVRYSGSDEIKELPEIKKLDFILRGQLENPNSIANDKCKFSKLNNCDACIHREKRVSGIQD